MHKISIKCITKETMQHSTRRYTQSQSPGRLSPTARMLGLQYIFTYSAVHQFRHKFYKQFKVEKTVTSETM